MSTNSDSPRHAQAGHSHSHSHHQHSRAHRALSLGAARSRDEARLGITTDYKDLSLHSAAANGNLGLVQYALSHGQPVHSVLDGVLPLHAAASSGNETIVRMLIEAGADVNSPRLSRRYTREGNKSSGISVGSQGSTPLHFAAANGHLSVLTLLLAFGADPRSPEKHGLTPAQMAATNGHHDAAALLQMRAQQLDDADEAGSEASSRSGGRAPSVRSSLSMTRRLHPGRTGGGGVNAQRSFDALASKLVHASHTAPLHALGLASSTSLHSLTSLTSSHGPGLGAGSPASSSQISLGAVSSSGGSGLGGPLSRQGSRKEGGAGSTTRRPSLPSVWEKASHPRAALRQAFSRNGNGRPGEASNAPDTFSEEEHEDGAEERQGAEYAEHRRSLEVHRPLRRDSYQGVEVAGQGMGSVEDEGDSQTEDDVPTPVQTSAPKLPVVPTRQPPSPIGNSSRTSSHHFYRPRQSSQLSKSSFGDGHSSFDADADDADRSVFHDEREVSTPPPPSSSPTLHSVLPPMSPRRARAASNPAPQSGTRSPLLQQVQLSQQQQQHFHQLQIQLRRSRAASADQPSTAHGGDNDDNVPLPPSSTGGGAGADSGGSASVALYAISSDPSGPYPSSIPSNPDGRRAFLSPSAAAAGGPLLSVEATAAQNRARSNSASTDGSIAARSNYSFAPSTSTAPTSIGAPSSPGGAGATRILHVGAKQTAITSVPVGPAQPQQHSGLGRHLAPVYEVRPAPRIEAASTSDDDEPTTHAQARSRVQRAERELLAMTASAGSSRPGSNGSGHGSSGSRSISQRSLKEQLAAYGKSLKAEQELVEREAREKRGGALNDRRDDGTGAAGYTFETIGKSSAASRLSSRTTAHQSTPASVPSWRAVPPIDRLAPPAVAAPSRRSTSPSATSSSAATMTHRGRRSQESNTMLVAAKTTPRRAHAHASDGATLPAPGSSPTSTRSGSAKSSSTTMASTVAAAVPAAASVLGQGHGGVSFVGVNPKAGAASMSSPLAGPQAHSRSHSHGRGHHHVHAQARSSRSDKSHSERGGSVTSPAISIKTRDQVEEDRREKARLEEQVPRAARTVPSERKGLKRWFGGGGSSANVRASGAH